MIEYVDYAAQHNTVAIFHSVRRCYAPVNNAPYNYASMPRDDLLQAAITANFQQEVYHTLWGNIMQYNNVLRRTMYFKVYNYVRIP